jgi:hypothetical protein
MMDIEEDDLEAMDVPNDVPFAVDYIEVADDDWQGLDGLFADGFDLFVAASDDDEDDPYNVLGDGD